MAKLRSFYVHNDAPRSQFHLDTGTIRVTEQSHKAECDINTILKQYTRTGMLNHINASGAQFAELPDQLDFQQALNTVMLAEAAFNDLPSKVRDRYSNSPSVFLSALSDPAQADFLREVGVLKPASQPASPTAVAAAASAEPKSAAGAAG